MIEQTVRMRIAVVRPPAGVRFCLQRGKENLEGTTATEGCDLHFDFELDGALGDAPSQFVEKEIGVLGFGGSV